MTTREPVDLETALGGVAPIRNEIANAFGAGWSLSGHLRLVRGVDGMSWGVFDGGGGVEVFHGVRPGDVITVAGNGTHVWAGNGVPADRAAIWGPRGMAFDGDGNMWIAHALARDQSALTKVGADGMARTVVPPGGVQDGSSLDFAWPYAIRDVAWSAATGLLVERGPTW